MKQILIFGYLGYGNLGDETNLKQLIELLRGFDQKINITVISAAPDRTISQYQVKAIGKFNFLGIILALSGADLLIGNSGSLFQDFTSKRSLCYYSFLIIAAKLFKVKVFLYGQGIGPLRSRIGKFLASRILALADVITVRDRLSIVALTELSVVKPELHLTAEPLLALNSLPVSLVEDYWKRRKVSKGIRLGLIIRDYPFLKKRFWEQLCESLGWNSEFEIYLIPVQPKDQALFGKLSAVHGLTLLPTEDHWEQLLGIVGGLDLLISARLHGLVAGVLQGVPCYGLAADPKVEGFCLQLGIPFTTLNSETEWMNICNQVMKLLRQPITERAAYRSKLIFWKARALENQMILKQYLQKDD